MATDQELINIIRDMVKPGLPVGLHTLKASVITEDRSRVEEIVSGMVRYGELTEIRKDRFIKAGA